MKPLALDGFIIATEHPAKLVDFYTNLLGGTQVNDNLVDIAGVQIILFPHDAVTGPPAQPERIMINFAVDDAEAFTAHANECGVTWKRPFEPEPFGLLATIADPDGNLIQFTQHNETSNQGAP